MSLEPTHGPFLTEPDSLSAAAELLRALGHPLRLRLVAALAEGPAHVGALAARLGVPPAIASQQLRILRMSELVAAVRAKGQAVYRLTDPRVVHLLACIAGQA